MCGICGFNFINKALIKKMADSLKHRGPDGEGFYFDGKISLGHRRLSIIDIKSGAQPMHNEDKTVWIVFNGEIYNYREIRPLLEKNGHKFYTNSDTEVIIHAYEKWGFDCLQKFNGMFALCIYDKNKNLLFLARDRFGIKPLYYYLYDGKIIFASEIKAILLDKKVITSPNDEVIFSYLKEGYIPEDKKETFFKNIYKILPSHYAIFKDGNLKSKRYYRIKNINYDYNFNKDEEEIIKKYRELLTDSVKLRLRSDVPVGSCLSGGIDSSSIVAVVDKLMKKKIKETDSVTQNLNCFSAVYDDKTIDERKYIKAAVKNKRIHSYYTFPKASGFWQELKKLIYFQDEPVITISTYAQWCVMKEASTKVKVVLDGQGSDEVTAGYLPYFRNFLYSLFIKKQYLRMMKEIKSRPDYFLRMILTYLKLSRTDNIAADFFPKTDSRGYQYFKNSFHNLTDRLLNDLKIGLPQVLKYEDRNSMAFGIEARLPFLDYRLVEYSFSLPEVFKIRNGWTKYILRQAMKDIVSPKILSRKDKLGFPVPDYLWFKKNKKNILKIFQSSIFEKRQYFHQEKIIYAFRTILGKRKKSYLFLYFWRILNLELWLRIFFDKK